MTNEDLYTILKASVGCGCSIRVRDDDSIVLYRNLDGMVIMSADKPVDTTEARHAAIRTAVALENWDEARRLLTNEPTRRFVPGVECRTCSYFDHEHDPVTQACPDDDDHARRNAEEASA